TRVTGVGSHLSRWNGQKACQVSYVPEKQRIGKSWGRLHWTCHERKRNSSRRSSIEHRNDTGCNHKVPAGWSAKEPSLVAPWLPTAENSAEGRQVIGNAEQEDHANDATVRRAGPGDEVI